MASYQAGVLTIRPDGTTGPLPARFLVDVGSSDDDPGSVKRYRGYVAKAQPGLFQSRSPYDFVTRYCGPEIFAQRVTADRRTPHVSPMPFSRTTTDLTGPAARRFMATFPKGVQLVPDQSMTGDLARELEGLTDAGLGRETYEDHSRGFLPHMAAQHQTYNELHRVHETEEIFYEGDQTGALRTGPLAMANRTIKYLTPGLVIWSHANQGQNIVSDLQTWSNALWTAGTTGTGALLEAKRLDGLTSKHVRAGWALIRDSLTPCRLVIEEVDVAEGGKRYISKVVNEERTLDVHHSVRKAWLQVRVGGVGIRTDCDKAFLQCHASQRRYAIVHNWDVTQLMELVKKDQVRLSHAVERDVGAHQSAFTFMTALVVLALKEWEVPEGGFLGSMRGALTARVAEQGGAAGQGGAAEQGGVSEQGGALGENQGGADSQGSLELPEHSDAPRSSDSPGSSDAGPSDPPLSSDAGPSDLWHRRAARNPGKPAVLKQVHTGMVPQPMPRFQSLCPDINGGLSLSLSRVADQPGALVVCQQIGLGFTWKVFDGVLAVAPRPSRKRRSNESIMTSSSGPSPRTPHFGTPTEQVAVAVKVFDLADKMVDVIQDDPNRMEQLEAMAMLEVTMYTGKLRALQGSVVPRCFGAWRDTHGRIFLLLEKLRPLQAEQLSDLPQSMKTQVYDLFRQVHAAGVCVGEVDVRHVMAVSDTQELRLIDFDRSSSGEAARIEDEMRVVQRELGWEL
ncbi:hypothetical protein BD324DRAFT_640155 [Kockovaella imperatae]|uniref:Protein kinase domain-containing protein n=1 Tax=Kockovaella imperatae TaxID=4999 RepID=A0A1Y1U718_9TREE|nr:hypothetical protein BD324DRAFT_640155 [Kockovaella imperatae]ORX33316.1 hypothetical protein BD324DRAFT_640155 [Kockovaella imperatae]